jgi:hypothetical protein
MCLADEIVGNYNSARCKRTETLVKSILTEYMLGETWTVKVSVCATKHI